MIVAIIENFDLPDKAEFMVDENGDRLIFRTHDNAENGVYYKHHDGDD
jgi:hypothetical protein